MPDRSCLLFHQSYFCKTCLSGYSGGCSFIAGASHVQRVERIAGTIDAELKAIEGKIKSDKKNDLLKHKDEIVSEIERQIVARYYFEKGQIKIGLRNDSEIQEAIKLLDDNGRYKSILKK